MLLQRRCSGCGAASRSICAGCRSALQADRIPADRLQEAAVVLGLDGLCAVTVYGATTRRLILAAKNGGRREVYRALAPMLAAEVSVTADLRRLPHVVTWIPPSRHRRRRRGFDHGRVLATDLARALTVDVGRMLVRSRGDRHRRRTRPERLVGPRLIARRRSPPHVLLVDDVMTTGGSLMAGAAALRRAGAERVLAAVVAVVDESSPSPPSIRAAEARLDRVDLVHAALEL